MALLYIFERAKKMEKGKSKVAGFNDCLAILMKMNFRKSGLGYPTLNCFRDALDNQNIYTNEKPTIVHLAFADKNLRHRPSGNAESILSRKPVHNSFQTTSNPLSFELNHPLDSRFTTIDP